MGGFWGSGGAWESQTPKQPGTMQAAPAPAAASSPAAAPIDLSGLGNALRNQAGQDINQGFYNNHDHGYLNGKQPAGAGSGHYMGAGPGGAVVPGATSVAPGGPVMPAGGGTLGATGFLPRGDPGYGLLPKQYGIDPNTAIIPGFSGWRSQLANGTNAAGSRVDASPFRSGQSTLGDQLAAQANGTGPSLAQGQFQQATDANLAHAFALGQSLHGPSAGGQLRGIQNQQAGISQNAAMQSAQLRMQEQMAARAQLGTLLAQGRGGDQQQQQMNDSLVKFYTEQGLSLDVAQMRARMEMEGMRSNASLGLATLNSGNDRANTQMGLGIASGAAAGIEKWATTPNSGGSAGSNDPGAIVQTGVDDNGNPIYDTPTGQTPGRIDSSEDR